MVGTLRTLVSVLLAAALLVGCDDAEPEPLRIWAASSLTDVLPQVARAWREHGGGRRVEVSFDASSRAARQIEAGAPADLFFSADDRWMDWLAERDRIVPDTRVELLGNRVVVAVPAGSEVQLDDPADLASGRVRRLALAGEGVPAGRYAEAALRSLGLWEALRDRVVRGSHVRATLAWVARGEVDAGLVYRTDVRGTQGVREAFAMPAATHPAIAYPAAVVRGAARAEAAADFLDFCRSTRARAIFEAAGFLGPPSR